MPKFFGDPKELRQRGGSVLYTGKVDDVMPKSFIEMISLALDNRTYIENSNAENNSLEEQYTKRADELSTIDPDNKNNYNMYTALADDRKQQIQQQIDEGRIIFKNNIPQFSKQEDQKYRRMFLADSVYEGNKKARLQEAKMFKITEDTAQKNNLPIEQNIRQLAIDKSKEVKYKYDLAQQQTGGITGFLGSFIGDFVGSMKDPYNIGFTIATAPLAPIKAIGTGIGALAKTAGKTFLQEAVLSVPVETAIQATAYNWRKTVDDDFSIRQAVYETGANAVFAGVFGGAVRLGVDGAVNIKKGFRATKEAKYYNDVLMKDFDEIKKEINPKLNQEDYINLLHEVKSKIDNREPLSDDFIGKNILEEAEDINTRYLETENQIDQNIYLRENILNHPRLDTHLKERENILAKDIIYDQKLISPRAIRSENMGEGYENIIQTANYDKNYAADFELTKNDVKQIRAGKINDKILEKMQNDLGRLDTDQDYAILNEDVFVGLDPVTKQPIYQKVKDQFGEMEKDLQGIKWLEDCFLG